MNPVSMTVINPWTAYWSRWGLNQQPPVLKSPMLPNELHRLGILCKGMRSCGPTVAMGLWYRIFLPCSFLIFSLHIWTLSLLYKLLMFVTRTTICCLIFFLSLTYKTTILFTLCCIILF